MLHMLTAAGILICAIQAIRSRRLIISALWLAGTSALVALELYLLGAPEIAVIELSVGAGLVTVLFVFAINLTGEEDLDVKGLIREPLALAVIFLTIGVLALLLVPGIDRAGPSPGETDFTLVMWGDRQMDLILQAVMVFCGVLGVLRLLSEKEPAQEQDTHQEKSA
ncbi:MAG: NADH-quinone oxidoreductase subunit J [Chloroflexota bacterium]|jgi:NADH:ubiquinone oxidoreductase subunit 6 (subunit J)